MNTSLQGLIAIASAVSAGVLIRWRLHVHRRTLTSHTPPVAQQPSTLVPAPIMNRSPRQERRTPLAVRMLYRNSRGEEAWYEGTLMSRKPVDDGHSTVNVRLDGESFVKGFLMDRMQRLQLREENSVIEGAAAIRETLIARLPLGRTRKPSSKARATPDRPLAPSAPVPNDAAPATAVTPIKTVDQLLPHGARGFAVFDLETTGVDTTRARIVEIGIVLLRSDGSLEEEWQSLINPGEPIPNSSIHGIDDDMVQTAPTFDELGPVIAEKLADRVLVAHNLHRFDLPILQRHFQELPGLPLNLGDGIDTMPKPRRKLQQICSEHGIRLHASEAHTALGDTRALAALLQALPGHLKAAQSSVRLLCSLPERTTDRSLQRSDVARSGARPSRHVEPATGGQGWKQTSIELQPGLTFMATGPQSTARDTEIRRAESHGKNLGLTYRKCNTIPKRDRPAFLLSTSLSLNSTKMNQAREKGFPVVLTRDLMRSRQGATVTAHQWQLVDEQP